MAELLNDDELEKVDGGKRIARTVAQSAGGDWTCSCGRKNRFDVLECVCGRKNPNLQKA
ncbi:MAG: hypothetical protein Q4G60_02410 [bacterium]|nr:hypothetical protein [bacterium]